MKLEFDPKEFISPPTSTDTTSVTLPVGYFQKIPKGKWARVCPDNRWSYNGFIFKSPEIVENESPIETENINLIHPNLVPEVLQTYGDSVLRKVYIRLGIIARPRQFFFWLLKYDPVKPNTWNASAMECAKGLETKWGTVVTDSVKHEYKIVERIKEFQEKYPWPEPIWPDYDACFSAYFNEAFARIIVTDSTHACFMNMGGAYAIEEF